ncbi:unnamed protein product, partial [Mesorhabditis belari]|uniref:Uncharacterized protein n=1 Tax=Mesorhabditis belari TaxID=2138241 RepID=A0AAF3J881_9BILA
MLRFILLFAFSTVVTGLTCYNGLKFISGGSVGQSTEECSGSGDYCYNMSASAVVMIDVMKAGCSKWRCMLAQDTCIRTSFQGIPVSLCCCSTDRCNVGEYSGQNFNTNNNNNNNNNNWNNNQDNQGGFGNNNNQDSNGFSDSRGSQQRRPSHSREDVEKAFKMGIDSPTQEPMTRGDRHGSRGGNDNAGDEETFERIDVRYTTQRPKTGGSGKFSSVAKGGELTNRRESTGGEIEI